MTELLTAISAATAAAGHTTELTFDEFPPLDDDGVYVVIPHEFDAWGNPDAFPDLSQRARTIALCTENAGTDWFEATRRLVPRFAAAVSINRASAAELRRLGHDCSHLQLGYTPLWDTWQGDPNVEREIDVLYLGAADPRRDPLLGSLQAQLRGRECQLLVPPLEPRVRPRPDYLEGAEKYERLRTSRVLLNLHRTTSGALEWMRFLEAICNGCVVVSEPCLDAEPLVAGEHFVAADVDGIAPAIERLLDDAAELARVRGQAYEFVGAQLPMSGAAAQLVDLAAQLPRRPRDTQDLSPSDADDRAATSNAASANDERLRPRAPSKRMKLVMTLLVRNEADIIEANLDYHLAQGVDFVIVTDHDSSDETVELLRPYERAGVVEVLREEGEEHHQSVRVTRMARLALTRHDADWVINNDADEFWWPLSGSLRDVFASIPERYGQIVVQRRNFVARPTDTGPFHSRLIYREACSLNGEGEALEPKVAHRAHPQIVVAPGNHSISGAELRPIPAEELLEVFHFPMRNPEQFERKVIQTGIGYEKLSERSPEVGRDQLQLLVIQREGGLGRFYEEAVLDDAALERGVRQGSIVLDRRLAEFMRRLPDGRAAAERPDGPQTRAFLSSALGAFAELDDQREALARAQSASAALEERLAAQQAELAGTGAALHSLRASRMVRWSAPARRLWYRVQQR